MKASPRSLPGTQPLQGSVILTPTQDGLHQAVFRKALYPYVPFQFFFPPFISVIDGTSEANSSSSVLQGEQLRCSWRRVLGVMIIIMEVLISHLQTTRKGVIYRLTTIGCLGSWTRDRLCSHGSPRLL